MKTVKVVADGPAEGIATPVIAYKCRSCNCTLTAEEFATWVGCDVCEGESMISVEPAAPVFQQEMQIVADKSPLSKRPFVKTRGSGWFWCHRPMVGGSSDWSVLYINALWGALIDGKYVRTDNFDDVVGPLEAPREN